MRQIFYTLLLICTGATQANAQVDPHFSQFYAYPLWLNPGMAGVMDGDYRFTGVYRNQWSEVMTPFNTAGFSADVATGKNLNLGANFMSQSAGDAGYKYLNAYATVAYSGIKFGTDNNQQITIGIQAGLLSRRFDPAKFQFGDQWNPITGYNPGTISADLISQTSSSVLDLGAGLSYMDASPDKKVNLFGGVAAFHLTKPEDPFVNSSTKQVLPVRFTVHAGARINLTETVSITPNLLYMRQGNASEKMIGLFTQLKANDYTDLLFGANFRMEDAIAPYVGVAFHNFALGVSYDVNISDLGKAVTGTNSLELSFTYIGRKTGKPLRYLSCPRF
ncbi:MAG: PorP/SprF family type IX secretion system membrane protein [Chitinophagaceae bacterium]|nr:PorP/SprF family type IX secretion system membrane protein [Chitinophagaceae bacterium]